MKKVTVKFFSVFIAVIMAISFVSCDLIGNENDAEKNSMTEKYKENVIALGNSISEYDSHKSDTQKKSTEATQGSERETEEETTDSQITIDVGEGPWYDSNGLEYEYVTPQDMSYLVDEPCFTVKGPGTCTSGDVVIPQTYKGLPIRMISGNAFKDCTFIKNVILPEGLTTILAGGFKNCSSLESIVIPVSLTHVDFQAFNGCDELASVFYKGTSRQWESIDLTKVNQNLELAVHYYYSATEPQKSNPNLLSYEWHFVNGVPTPWEEVFQ